MAANPPSRNKIISNESEFMFLEEQPEDPYHHIRKRTRPMPKPAKPAKDPEMQPPANDPTPPKPEPDASNARTRKAKTGDHTRRKTSTSNDYEVGYGRPPVKTQFQPGQSGNRKGRPKAARNVNSIIRDSVFKLREATIDGKKKRMTQFEIGVHQLMNKFMTGDAKAAAQVLALLAKMQELGSAAKSEEAGSAALPDLTDSGRRMIARHQTNLFRDAGLSEDQIATLLANLGLPVPEPNSADGGGELPEDQRHAGDGGTDDDDPDDDIYDNNDIEDDDDIV